MTGGRKTIAEPEPEFIGIMCEALCAESYRQVMPACFDVCLKQRCAQSPEDAEMTDPCVNARVFGPGCGYDNRKGVSFFFRDLLVGVNHPDITSFYKKREKAANKYCEKAVKLFEEGNRARTRFPGGLLQNVHEAK